MKKSPAPAIWFACGSQHLYGPGPLQQVAANAREVAGALHGSGRLPLPLEFKALLTTPDEITRLCIEANADPACAGLVFWMHTFSPAKMWIRGLSTLRKPFCHLHTQFHRDLPWGTIDMDFMNLHQAAHGDREFGFIGARLRLARTVVVGHWSAPATQDRLGTWMRAAAAWHDLQGARFVRFGDNMRQVAVTEGDKVAAEARFGFSVNTHGVGDLAAAVDSAPASAVDALIAEYLDTYDVAAPLRPGGPRHDSLRDGARIEAGLRAFLTDGGYLGFTTTFEDLHGLAQLPGLAVQRLMAEGYGFGAEGDWKTAALLRAMKVMADGLPGGTSFMEDYTYHLEPGRERVLGAHMLEICPSIAGSKPSLEVHPLGIGGKADPVRLVFTAPPGPALNASLIDLGNRFRLLVNPCAVVEPDAPLPRLPVARAVWVPEPDFATALAAWIHAGGAHHTGFSYAVTTQHLEDFAAIAGIECAVIDRDTRLRPFLAGLRADEVYHHVGPGQGRP
jgi:L-arabinose isomerase